MMRRAWVLMTAMPFTKGHANLIQFASAIAPTTVVLSTQPDEPFVKEREQALYNFNVTNCTFGTGFKSNIIHVGAFVQQVPKDENDYDFWYMWVKVLVHNGFKKGDYIVGSEMYCKTLAEYADGIFMPYDLERSILDCNATAVRDNPLENFSLIHPTFQPVLRKTVTFFGAESCGKTTTSKNIAKYLDYWWLPEWARPYLEALDSPPVSDDHMYAIWQGQLAMQRQAQKLEDKPFILQDTDLFSTVGYWRMYGSCPEGIVHDAVLTKSDLYIVMSSDIPFEEDPIRYGGKVRESDDQFWIDICEEFGLNYVYVDADAYLSRELAAAMHMNKEFVLTSSKLEYERVK